MANKQSEFINRVKLTMPEAMDYSVSLSTPKEYDKFVKRIEKIVRSSLEYKDYIQYLKENVGLDKCVFFQNVTNKGNTRGRVSIEMHHEPFTLYDITCVVINKYVKDGLPINDLFIADEIIALHYENKVGLVPLSKTAHQLVHNSDKLVVPLNLCYGSYSEFLSEYDKYIDDDMGLYDKLEHKIEVSEKLTPDDFQAIMKEFTYLDIEGVDEIEKLKLKEVKELA